MCGASEARQYRPSGISPPSSENVSCQAVYGPATTATRYVEMISLGAKMRVSAPPSAPVVVSTTEFDTTCHSAGAVMISRWRALRSGWSKQAYMRFASAVSNWV
jgi:hypothetical protein